MRKGFTLVEILIVIFVLSFLGISAVSSYYSSQSTLSFLGQFREVLAVVKSARDLALNNQMVEGEMVERFGVMVREENVVVFVDDGDTPNKYDSDLDEGESNSGPDFLIKEVTIDSSKFSFSSNDLPIYLMYESGSGNFSAYDKTSNPISEKYVYVTMNNKKDDTKRHIMIFRVSGLAEEVKNLPEQP